MHRPAVYLTLAVLLPTCGGGHEAIAPLVRFGSLEQVAHAGAVRVGVAGDRDAWFGIETRQKGATLVGRQEGVLLARSDSFLVERVLTGEEREVRPLAILSDGRRVEGVWQDLAPAPLAPPQGDDFAAPNLDRTRWHVEDRFGLARLALTDSNGERTLDVHLPGGVPYLSWHQGNDGLRLLENAPDQDFDVAVRSLNGLSVSGTGHGIHVEAGPGDWMRFDFGWNGGRLEVFAARFAAGVLVESEVETIHEGVWPEGAALTMRVQRTGNRFEQSFSFDGETFLPGFTLTADLLVRRVGLEFIHKGSSSAPLDARIDWIDYSPADGRESEDSLVPDLRPPWLYRKEVRNLGPGLGIVQAWSDEPAEILVEWGPTRACDLGSAQAAGEQQISVLLPELPLQTPLWLRLRALDAAGSSSWWGPLMVTTLSADPSLPQIVLSDAEPSGTSAWSYAPEQLGHPQLLTGVRGQIVRADGTPYGEAVSLRQRLDGGAWVDCGIGQESNGPVRLTGAGSFHAEVRSDALADGQVHTLELLLETLGGAARVARCELLPGTQAWPLPSTIDWTLVGEAGEAVVPIDGDWQVAEDLQLGRALVLTEPGYTRGFCLGEARGDQAWENYEVLTTVRVLALDPSGYTPGTHSYALGFALRWQGYNPIGSFEQPAENIYPQGGIFFQRWYEDHTRWQLWHGDGSATEEWYQGPTLAVGEVWHIKLSCEEQFDGGTRYALSLWPEGGTAPAAPQFEALTEPGDPIDGGSFAILAHHVTVGVGAISVTPLQ